MHNILAATLMVIFSSLPFCVFAEDISENYSNPVSVVKSYTELDAHGAWLSEGGRKQLQKYTEDIIFIPTIISPVLITDYSITLESSTIDSASIVITYNVIGDLPNFGYFKKRITKKSQRVTLRRSKESWRIKTQIFPHLLWNQAIKQIKKAKSNSYTFIEREKNKVKRAKLKKQVKYENRIRDKLIDEITHAAMETTGKKSNNK